MQLKNVVEPFGEVNIYPQPDGSLRIVATILMEPVKEGAQTGIAIDGSGSMQKAFGASAMVSSLFASTAVNYVKPVAQQMCAYLANKVDADGGTTAIYWATGPAGSQIEEIGDLTAQQAETFDFGGPKLWGGRARSSFPPSSTLSSALLTPTGACTCSSQTVLSTT